MPDPNSRLYNPPPYADEEILLNLALLVEILNQTDGKCKSFSLTRRSQTVCS